MTLCNLSNDSDCSYDYNFLSPLHSDLLKANGFQHFGNQISLDDSIMFNVYYENDSLDFSTSWLDINDSPTLIAGNYILLNPRVEIDEGIGTFTATIENKLDDYDINSDGQQNISEYDPDFRLRYFMSVFGPRLIFRNGMYRYDYHIGSDIINLERPEDDIEITELPQLQCMCDGVVVEYVKLDDPADIINPNGVGRKTGIHCTNGVVIEPPLGDNSKIIEQTGEGQYIVVKCNEQYPISFGFTDPDIYIAYRHMYSFEHDFSIGDSVKKGDILGRMGQSGITSNYHLHLSALRRACDDNPSKRFANVHPIHLFNPTANPHLIRKLEYNLAYNNNSVQIDHQKMNPEVYFLNYDTFLAGEDPIIRIAMPYYYTSIGEIIIRDTSNISPHPEWTFDLIQRSTLSESECDMNYWDMNGSGDIDTVFIHHFNRGTSASFLYDSHKNEGHYDGHPSKQWPITDTGIYRSATYILDIKIVNFSGEKEDLQVEISDIWGNRIKAEPD